MTREEAARALAEAMGWDFNPGPKKGNEMYHFSRPAFYRDDNDREGITFPTPDAPLHEHLAFVGRVAEALDWSDFYVSFCGKPTQLVVVQHVAPRQFGASARDPSWSAMLAAIEAINSRKSSYTTSKGGGA